MTSDRQEIQLYCIVYSIFLKLRSEFKNKISNAVKTFSHLAKRNHWHDCKTKLNANLYILYITYVL